MAYVHPEVVRREIRDRVSPSRIDIFGVEHRKQIVGIVIYLWP